MIINKQNKSFQTRSDKPNSNWLNDNNYFVVPDNSKIAQDILNFAPLYDLDLDENGNLIGVHKTEPTVEMQEQEILSELKELDLTINRATEDLYELTETTPYKTVQETIDRKIELREELKVLKSQTEV